MSRYKEWGDCSEVKVKCSLKSGDINDVLINLIKQKSGKQLLVDYKTFSEDLLPTGFTRNIHSLNFKLWIMPKAIDCYKTKTELAARFFESNKKEIINEYLCQIKLYTIPNDLQYLNY